jgi:signal transduction histidine kinase
MRTRSRLLLGFVAVHIVLSVVTGAVAWRWLDASMRAQAEDSARSLGRVIAQGGFPLTAEVVAKLRDLTGYEFSVLPARTAPQPGTVQVEEEGKVVQVAYRSSAYERASAAVLVGTLVVMLAGTLVFALVARWLAGQFATPVERLVGAARVIGSGDLDAAVAPVGSGELRELAGELEVMRLRLRDLDHQHRQSERLAAVGTFTATIAHEVRNPLSAVRLTVQMLARRSGGADASLQLIMDELERLDLIVDELLAYSKGMDVRPEVCDLRAAAETVVRLLRRQAEHAGVTLAIIGTASVRADPARLRQLLMNLVLNAIQAQHGDGEVRIELLPDGLCVRDTGPGVDPELVPHLFEAFASKRPGGIGLGLHLARAIAQAHGARLEYEAQSRGACFALRGLQEAGEAGEALGARR